MRMAPKRS
jgi:DNA-binding FadR family transcriptional regulator